MMSLKMSVKIVSPGIKSCSQSMTYSHIECVRTRNGSLCPASLYKLKKIYNDLLQLQLRKWECFQRSGRCVRRFYKKGLGLSLEVVCD